MGSVFLFLEEKDISSILISGSNLSFFHYGRSVKSQAKACALVYEAFRSNDLFLIVDNNAFLSRIGDLLKFGSTNALGNSLEWYNKASNALNELKITWLNRLLGTNLSMKNTFYQVPTMRPDFSLLSGLDPEKLEKTEALRWLSATGEFLWSGLPLSKFPVKGDSIITMEWFVKYKPLESLETALKSQSSSSDDPFGDVFDVEISNTFFQAKFDCL